MNSELKEQLNKLNKEQLEAVTTTEGYVRVIAGAGSGKTRALTMRYAYLLDELGISSEKILSVTFTNKAANEMKTRVSRLVGGTPTPYIMTFHSFCNRFLHSEIEALNISSSFKIMDTDDQIDILKVVYNELNMTNSDFPYKRALTEIIGDGCKCGRRIYLDNYEELLKNSTTFDLHQLMQLAPTKELKIIYGYLREQKRDACLDFEDLLNMTLHILKTRKDIREVWEKAFDYIQVDEFQDVSLREVELLGILSKQCGNVFVVGDDSQCIVEGSLVRGEYGVEKPIEKVKIGDKIFCGVGHGEIDNFSVDSCYSREYNGEIYKIILNNGSILKVTPDHKLYVRKNTKDIDDRDYCIKLKYFSEDYKDTKGNNPRYTYGHSVSVFNSNDTFIDFDNATDYANSLRKSKGLPIKISANLTRFDREYDLCLAQDIKEGDYLPVYSDSTVLNGDCLQIISSLVISVKKEQYKGRVYDLNVNNTRNFIVNNVLVHNCIYSFRGSDVNCIIQFEDIMSRVQNRPVKAKSIYLVQNYRSTPEILNVSNALIKHNQNRVDKDLITEKLNGDRVTHYHARNVYQQANWVVNKINSLNYSYEDVAILYRTHASSRAIEEKLIENSIPYEVLSGVSFYSRKEVKDVLAVLSIVAFGDNLSFMRVVKTLSLGIGPKKIATLKELSGNQTTLYNTLSRNIDTKMFKSTKGKWLIDFIERLRVYSETETISMLMGRVYDELNLEETYKESEIERWENLQELKRSAQRYEYNQHEKVDLGEYLSMLSLYTSSDSSESGNKVKLMTVHGAKGLEYPVVFVVDMNEGIMPSSRTVTVDELEEERRIAYVALTRAKDLLFMTDAEGENYDKSYRLPSRFLFNIPRDVCNLEGKIDEYVLQQLAVKVKEDNNKMKRSSYSILNNIEDTETIKEGTRVRHTVFGEGTVIKIVDGAYAIMFDTVGVRGIRSDSDKIEKI